MSGWSIGGKALVAFALAGALVACSLVTSLDGLSGDDDGGGPSNEAGGPDVVVQPDARTLDGPVADGASASAYRDAVLADTPLAYYRLGSRDGAKAIDEVGGHDGTYVGPPAHVAGATRDDDMAADFGSGTYVSLGDAFAFTGRAAFSIEAWVRPEGGSTRCIVARNAAPSVGQSPDKGWGLYVDENGGLDLSRWVPGDEGVATSKSLPSTKYTHVVATYDGTTMTMFFDGVVVESASDKTGSVTTVTNPALIGASRGGEGCRYKGAIDDVAIYDRALGADRVKAHYDLGRRP